MRLALLFVEPYLSTDIYRYIWDGRVQAAGINPYRYVPNAPELAQLRDAAIFPLINRASYAPTIYPPAAQAIFLAAYAAGRERARHEARAARMRGGDDGRDRRPARAARSAADARRRLRLAPASRLGDRRQRPRGRGHDRAADGGPAAVRAGADDPGRRGGHAGRARQARGRCWRCPCSGGRGTGGCRSPSPLTVVLAYLPYLSVGAGVLGFLPAYLQEEGFASGSGSGFKLLWLVEQIAGPAAARRHALHRLRRARADRPRAGGRASAPTVRKRPRSRSLELAADRLPGALLAALSLVFPGARAVPGARPLRSPPGCSRSAGVLFYDVLSTTCCRATRHASRFSPWRRWPPSPMTCGADGAERSPVPVGETP